MPADIDTAALRELAEAATQGTWKWRTTASGRRLIRDDPGIRVGIIEPFIWRGATQGEWPDLAVSDKDRAYIAAANPATILALLDQIDAAEARIAELEETISDNQGAVDHANAYHRLMEEAEARSEAAERRATTALDQAQSWRARATDAEAQVAERDAEIARLRKLADWLITALAEARDDVDCWAAYASEYFREKHDLAGDLARIDGQIDAARAALTAAPAAPARDLAAENARLREAITASQAVLARYIVPDSGISDRDAINDLLGILDHRDLVEMMRRRAALSPPQQAGSETGEQLRGDPQTAWKRAHLHAYDYAMRRIDRTEAFRRMVRDGLPCRDAAEFVQLCEQQGGKG